MKKTKKNTSQIRSEGFFDVIKLFEGDSTLFACIPDNWYEDEEKGSCFWPPTKGKNVSVRALKREKPDETWERYDCVVVKEGFVTYSCGQALVREKCTQQYNTSSAEEHMNDVKFRRQHPALSLSVSASFEDIFKKKKPTETSENCQRNTSMIDLTSKAINEKTSAAFMDSEDVTAMKSNRPPHRESCVATGETSPSNNSSVATVTSLSLNRVHRSDVNKGQSSNSNSSLKRLRPASSQSPNSVANSLHEEKEGKMIRISPGKNRRSGSVYSPLMDLDESSSHKENAIDFDRVDRRSTQEFEGTRANCSQRSRSTSRQSCSSNDSVTRNRQRSIRQGDFADADGDNRRGFSPQSARSSHRERSISQQSRSSESDSSSIGENFLRRRQDECSSSCKSRMLMAQVSTELRSLTKTVLKNQHENDRRLTRMEVAINKTLVRLGDITRLNAAHSRNTQESPNEDLRHRGTPNYVESSRRQQYEVAQFSGESSRRQRHETGRGSEDGENSRNFVNPRGQRMCALPIMSLNELTGLNQQLMDDKFFTFLIYREVEFCTPGKNTTNNVVMTSYLKRFISLRVRSLLTLKELQSDCGMTLFADFFYIYKFLIEVAREGYKSCNKSLTEKDANEALRIVWGRTKQMLNDEKKKKK